MTVVSCRSEGPGSKRIFSPQGTQEVPSQRSHTTLYVRSLRPPVTNGGLQDSCSLPSADRVVEIRSRGALGGAVWGSGKHIPVSPSRSRVGLHFVINGSEFGSYQSRLMQAGPMETGRILPHMDIRGHRLRRVWCSQDKPDTTCSIRMAWSSPVCMLGERKGVCRLKHDTSE